jgi:hypothetical protein
MALNVLLFPLTGLSTIFLLYAIKSGTRKKMTATIVSTLLSGFLLGLAASIIIFLLTPISKS